MRGSIDKIDRGQEPQIKASSGSGKAALIFSIVSALMLAFLLPFGLLQYCSAANIAIFVAVLGVSAILAFSGIIIGAISYRTAKNRMALTSLLFNLLYVALLIYLIRLIYA
jgi:hypothetical protein